jgi:hypothetical protein
MANKKTVIREPMANFGPMDRLPSPCVICVNAMALYIKQYDQGDLLPSDLARKLLDAYSILKEYEKQAVRTYCRQCQELDAKGQKEE